MLTLGTVFSGIGTPELALKHLNIPFKTLFAAEIDKYARQTYLENNELPETFYEDATKIDGNLYTNKIDVFVGGSPCQSFSIAGKRGGFEDTRGTLFFEYARLVKEIQPKVFIYENVKGLKSHDQGRTFDTVMNTFQELGYALVWDVINTKDYGVPQNRERIYIVGVKASVNKFKFLPKQPLTKCLGHMLDMDVDAKYYLNSQQVKAIEKSAYSQKRDSLMDLDDCSYTLLSRNYKDPKCVRLIQTHQYNVNTHECRKRIYSAKGVSPTVTTPSGGYSEIKVNIDDIIFRKLTPREYFRLQGFDDSFKFPKGMSNTQLYKQAGNGMSRNVLEMIFSQLFLTKELNDYI